MGSPSGSKSLPELMDGPNADLAAVSKGLALQFDENCGRYFRATKDIKPAQVLVSSSEIIALAMIKSVNESIQ